MHDKNLDTRNIFCLDGNALLNHVSTATGAHLMTGLLQANLMAGDFTVNCVLLVLL